MRAFIAPTVLYRYDDALNVKSLFQRFLDTEGYLLTNDEIGIIF